MICRLELDFMNFPLFYLHVLDKLSNCALHLSSVAVEGLFLLEKSN